MPYVEFDGELDAPGKSPQVTYTEFDGALDPVKKESLLSRVGSAAKLAASGTIDNLKDAVGLSDQPAEAKSETINLPGSVMHGRPAEKGNAYPAGAPVRPEARLGITHALEAATPEKRAEIAGRPDYVGQVAAQQMGAWQKQDAMAAELPSLEGMSTRVEDHRRNLITTGGMTPESADNKARSDVAMGNAVDMPGTAQESKLDFEAQRGVERYWNDFTGGVVGSTGASLSYLGKKTNAQSLSDIGDSMDAWAQGKQPAEGNFSDKLVNAVGSMASFYVPGIGVMKGASALSIVSPVMAKWAGAGTMSAIEAAAEADGVFKELKRKGYTDEQAMSQADKGFMANMVVLGVTNKIGLFNDLKMFDDAGKLVFDNAVKKGAVGALSEGPGQELPQQMIQNYLTGRPLMEGAGEAALIGSIVGGGSAVIGGIASESTGAAQPIPSNAANLTQRGIDAGVIASTPPNPAQVPAGQIVPERGVLTRAVNIAATMGVLPQQTVAPQTDDALLSDVQSLAYQGEQNGAAAEPGTGGLDAGSPPEGGDISGGIGGNVVSVGGDAGTVADGTGQPGLAGPDAGSAGESGPAGNGVREGAVNAQESHDDERVSELNRLNPQLGGRLNIQRVDSGHPSMASGNDDGLGEMKGGHNGSTITIVKGKGDGATVSHEIRHMIDMLMDGYGLRKWLAAAPELTKKLVDYLKAERKAGRIDSGSRMTDVEETAQSVLDAFYRNKAGLKAQFPDVVKTLEEMGADKYAHLMQDSPPAPAKAASGQYLPKAPAPKAVAPAAEVTTEPKTFSIGTMPNNAEPITVKDGAIHIGKYPAQHFETGEDITVKPGASKAQIRDALKAAGAIGRGVKVFGVEKEAPKSKVKAKRIVDNTRDSLITAIGKLGGFHTDSVEANDIRTLLGVTGNMKIPVGSGLPVFLFNKNGKKPDDMAGALHEHGYLDEHDMNDMLDKLYNDKDQGSKYAEARRGEEPEQEHEGARHGYDDLPEADQAAVSEVVAEAEDMLDDIPFLDIRTANKITSKQFKTIEEEEEAIFGGYNEKTNEGTAAGTEDGHGETDARGAQSRGEDRPGEAPGESAGVDSPSQGFSLESQTEASRREREQEIADAIAAREADQRKADAEAKRASDQKEIDARMKGSVDNFQLGQSAEESLAGQGDIFSQPTSKPSANTIFTEDAAAAARALLKKKLGQVNTGLDPEVMQAGITLAGYHIEKGARTFSAYAKAMIDDLGDVVKPYLKSWYMGIKYDPRAAAFAGEMDSAASVESTDVRGSQTANNGFVRLGDNPDGSEIWGDAAGTRQRRNDGLVTGEMTRAGGEDKAPSDSRYKTVKELDQDKPKPATPDQGTHYAAGQADFKAGKPRVLPSYFTDKTGKNAKDWYRGWDAANIAAPVNEESPLTIPLEQWWDKWLTAAGRRYAMNDAGVMRGDKTAYPDSTLWRYIADPMKLKLQELRDSKWDVATAEQNATLKSGPTNGDNHANPIQAESVPAGSASEDQADAATGNRDRQPLGAGLAGGREGAGGSGAVSGGPAKPGGTGAGSVEQSGEQSPGTTRDHSGVRPESEPADDFVIDAEAAATNPSIVAQPNIDYTDPYETVVTRPDTRPEQLTAGRGSLADAERRILGRHHSAMPGGPALLGSRISADFRSNGGTSLVGQEIAGPEDLAFVAQVLRDPRFETFRMFYTDDAGKIVGERAYSSRLAGAVYIPEDHSIRMRADMAEHKATGYWLLHNHPSGSANESDADLKLTANMARMVKGFQGHVVIDHNEYNHISVNGMAASGKVVKAPQLAAIDLLANPEKAHPLLGSVVSGPAVLAELAKRLQTKDGYVVLIGTDAQRRISLLTEVPVGYTKGRSGNKVQSLRSVAALKRATRETGSTALFAVVPGNLMEFSALIDSGLFRDVVTMDGKSAEGMIWWEGLPNTKAERRGGKSMVAHPAWHGSPYDHDGFSMEHVGTGEGAQAYGFGLYFAGSREVAEWYKTKLSGGSDISTLRATKDGKDLSGYDLLEEYFKPGRQVKGYAGIDEVVSFSPQQYGKPWHVTVKQVLDQFGNKPKSWDAKPRSHATQPDAKLVKEVLESDGWKVSKGRLYQVELAPAADEYLDFDRPLSDLSGTAKSAIFEGSPNSVSGYAKFFSDLSKGESFRSKGFGGLDAPTQSRVLEQMFAASKNSKVFDSVVQLIPVDVVNILERSKLTPDVLLHNKAMLHDLLSPKSANAIPGWSDAATSLVDAYASLAAKQIDGFNVRGAAHKFGATNGTRVFSHVPIINELGQSATGGEFYRAISKQLGSDKAASEYLHSIGIRGIRYLDGGSRATTGGEIIDVSKGSEGWTAKIRVTNRGGVAFSNSSTMFTTSKPYKTEEEARAWAGEKINGGNSNFVIFDDKDVTISEKFDQPVPGYGNAPTRQQQIPSITIPEETKSQAAQRVVQDKFNRFKVLQDWVKSQGMDLSEAADVYLAETLMSGRISTRKQDFRENQMGPLIQKTQSAGISMEQVGEFLKIQHAPEANKRAREIHHDPDATAYGVTDQDASDAMDEFKRLPNFAEIKAISNEWRSITGKTKQILLDAGILSEEMAQAWDSTYSQYVPVKGMEDQPGNGTGKGLNVNGRQKKRLGHELRDEGIIENILRDHERAISLDEKNLVGKSLIRFALAAKNPDIITVSQPVKRQVLKEGQAHYMVTHHGADIAGFDNLNDARRHLADESLKVGGDKRDFDIAKTSDPVRVMLQASPMLADNEVNVYVAGHAIRVQINDEIAARAYTSLGVEHLNAVLSAGRAVNTWLSKAYTGYSPDFIFTNPIRDAIQGAITLTGNYGAGLAAKIFSNYPLAVKELSKHFRKPGSSSIVTDYRANGGSTGAAYLSDLERIGDDIQASYNEYAGMVNTYQRTYSKAIEEGKGVAKANSLAILKSGASGFKNIPVIGHFLNLMEHINALTENALRVATYHALVKEGVSKPRAAEQAKNLMNFNRKGEISNQAGALYLFFNPNVQGSQVIYRALVESEHKGQARALAGTMVLSAMALAALACGGGYDDKEKWNNTPDYVKDGNLVIGYGDYQITLPLPYGYRVFHTLGNVMFDYAQGIDGYKLGIRLASSVFSNFSPVGNPTEGEHGLFQIMPTIPKMILGPGVNEDSFGRAITPKRFNEAKPDSQMMNRTSKGTLYASTAEGLNALTGGTKYEKGAIDVSPETLKYWVKSVTGGAGQSAMDAIHIPAMAAQGVAPQSPRDIPIARRFVRETGVSDTRSAFWARANEAKKSADAFGEARKNRDAEAVKDILKENKPLIELSHYAENQQRMAKAKRDEIDRIKNDDNLSLLQKTNKMKLIENEESAIYTRFIRQFDKKMAATKAVSK